MTISLRHTVTQLLLGWNQGDQNARDQLMPLVYDELRKLAGHYMRRERRGHPMQTTDLVHEAYLRLIDQRQVTWQNRAHFFAISAQLMRRIIVDHARAASAKKRGGRATAVDLEAVEGVLSAERSSEMIALDEALKALAAVDERKSQVVEMRYFGGLSVDETAAALDVSPNTVMRDWNLAKAWLQREMQ
jgi:RNA polymerase sigma factor (TIGR02999 family)